MATRVLPIPPLPTGSVRELIGDAPVAPDELSRLIVDALDDALYEDDVLLLDDLTRIAPVADRLAPHIILRAHHEPLLFSEECLARLAARPLDEPWSTSLRVARTRADHARAAMAERATRSIDLEVIINDAAPNVLHAVRLLRLGGPDCDVGLESPIQRGHVVVNDEGLVLLDAGTSVGLTVNRAPIERHVLRAGDVVGVDGDALRLIPDRYVGRVVAGRFRLVSVFDVDRIARTYHARDVDTGAPALAKVLTCAPDELDDLLARLRVASLLDHPRIVKTFCVCVEDDGVACVVSRVPLGRAIPLVRRRAREVVDIGIAAAEAIGEAHDHGAIHGVLTLAHIHEDEDGFISVSGFGLWTPSSRTEAEASSSDDVWCLGRALWSLGTGTDGWPNTLLHGKFETHDDALARGLPHTLRDMLDIDPARRPPIVEVIQRLRALAR